MSARSAIELSTFEQIEAGARTALLRVTGDRSDDVPSDTRPSLLLIGGDRIQRLPALAGPPDPPGVLRAAYPVSASLLDAATEFALEFDDGTRVVLPAPSIRRRSPPGEPAAPEGVPSDAAAAERETEINRLRTELAQQAEQTAATTAALQASADLAEAEAAQQRQRADQLQSALEQAQSSANEAHDSLRIARETIDQLQRQLVGQTEEATTTTARLQALVEIATAEAAEHRHRLQQLETEGDLDLGDEESTDPEEQLRAASARIARIEAELTEVRTISGGLAAELDEAQTRADTLAEVVRAETTRREGTMRELQLARQEIDALGHELERARLDAAVQHRPARVTAGEARERDEDDLLRHPDARPTRVTDPSPRSARRDHGAVQTLPAAVTAGLVLFVLGIVIAILFLTGAIG